MDERNCRTLNKEENIVALRVPTKKKKNPM